jgi:hypothetical protein
LELSWFSCTEDRFYAGKFGLPMNKILELFRAGTASPEAKERLPFDRIIVGMAPGGDVSVWVGARRIVKEIATFRAQSVDLPWSTVLDNQNITRPQYIELALREALSPEALKRVRAAPVPLGRWSLFAKRFPWTPRVRPGSTGRDLWIHGLNGEVEWVDLSGKRKDVDPPPSARGAPKELSLYWQDSAGSNLSADITFDEDESMAAFNKLSGGESSEALTLELAPADVATKVDVFLLRGKEHFRFERTQVKIYKTR